MAQPSSQVDIVPTILDYLGLPIPDELPGESLRPYVQGSPMDRTRGHLTECTWENVWSYRSDGMKVILRDGNRGRERRVFDLDADPEESNDLAETGQRQALLEQWEKPATSGARPWKKPRYLRRAS